MKLNPSLHENHYFTSDDSFANALLEATDFVRTVELDGGSLVSLSTAEFYQDDVQDKHGFHAPLYQVFVTVVR